MTQIKLVGIAFYLLNQL